MKKTTYYLFGSTASEYHFNHEGMSANNLAKAIIEMDYYVSLFDEYSHPSELLSEFQGWDGFYEISEELYAILLENLKNLNE